MDNNEDKMIPPSLMEALMADWMRRIDASRQSPERKEFMAVLEQCMSFYKKAGSFMWSDDYMSKNFGAGAETKIKKPDFALTINKAFELVAIYGPHLYWRNPYRRIRPYDYKDFPPEAFAFLGPQGAEFHQMLMQQEMLDRAVVETRSDLLEEWLEYTKTEQDCGLAAHATNGINQALVGGRGVLWPEAVTFPGSQQTITGAYFGDVRDLFIDSDCNDPLLRSAKWIARRHVNATWEVEDRFDLPRGSLREHGNLKSRDVADFGGFKIDPFHRIDGKTHDQIVWYEVWSKGGIGTRHSGFETSYHDKIDAAVGDYAYLCMAPSVPWALNAHPEKLEHASDDELMRMFAWPFAAYLENRWPVALLDFNPDDESCWPIAMLKPALGELTTMNILLSAYVDRAWSNRRLLIAYLESAQKDVEKYLNGDGQFVKIPLNDVAQKSINEIIQFLQQPDMNNDLLDALNYLSVQFEKRTGLTEFMYAVQTKVSRSARDVATKEEKASVRPDKMAQDVAAWMEQVAELEKILAAQKVEGKDVEPHMGMIGAVLWDEHIANQDPEVVVRGLRATVSASDIRKPNRQRETANMQNLLGFLAPVLQQYATLTGDSNPLNAFIQSLGESMEQPTQDWQMGPWMPQPPVLDHEQQAAQQEMQGLEMAGKAADVQAKEATAQGKAADAQKKTVELLASMQSGGQDDEHIQRMVQSQETHDQSMEQAAEKFRAEMLMKAISAGQQTAQIQAGTAFRDARKQSQSSIAS